jgi:hypothetical protein
MVLVAVHDTWTSVDLLRDDQFQLIRLKTVQHSLVTKLMYDYLAQSQFNSKQCCVFDKFKNIDELDDKLCKEITRWSKKHLLIFQTL